MSLGCGYPVLLMRLHNLLVRAWLALMVGSGVLEAEKPPEILLQQLLGAEDSRRLILGCCCGAERASRVTARACGCQSWAGERVCRGATGYGCNGDGGRMHLARG
eukprot:4926952-Prymnesium_polylepis.1